VILMASQEDLELEIISYLTKGEDERIRLLRDQFDHSKVISHEISGVGSYARITVDKQSVKPFETDFNFGDVYIQCDELSDGAAVLVFVRSGYIEALECSAYGDEWPNEFTNIKLSYMAEPRDFSDIL